MILIIDHQDSFTRNLEHLLSSFDEVRVKDRKKVNHNDMNDACLIVLSPGPGKPDDYPETKDLFHYSIGRKPVLGVCLGFQLILEEEGGEIIRQDQVLHGVETEIEISPGSLTYKQIKGPLRVARYHSLQVSSSSLNSISKTLRITARDPIRNVPMSFEDSDRMLFGLQYHPESFLTNSGKQIIQNIHHASMDRIGKTDRAS